MRKWKSNKLGDAEIEAFLAVLRTKLKGFKFFNQHEPADEIVEEISPTIDEFFRDSRRSAGQPS